MRRCLTIVALSLLGSCRAGDAELSALLAELQQLARSQQERIDAYESLVAKQQAEEAPRRLQAPSIFTGGQQLAGARSYTATEANELLMTHVWLLLCGALAMFMQAGFTMIETGVGRVKNAQVILLKNLTAVTASILGWWTLGWSIAYSGPMLGGYKENKAVGYEQFAAHHFMITRKDGQVEPSTDMLRWFVSWAYCSAATAIATAGVGERINFLGSLIFSYVFSAFIYPMVVASTWGGGWLADMNRTGYFDFAGSGIVFMSGGVAALMGALISGRRAGRFDGFSAMERVADWPGSFQPRSMPMVVLGTFIIWFGFYGVVCGATRSMKDNEKGMQAAQAAMNTTIAAAASGLSVFLLRTVMRRKYDIAMFCNGILAGLVSIAAGCSTVDYGPAVAIGCVGGVLYFITSLLLRMGKVDDPADAFAVYGVPGMWGVLAAAIFDWGSSGRVHSWQGFRRMTDSTGAGAGDLGKDLVVANLALIGAVFGWVAIVSAIVFLILKVAKLLKAQTPPGEAKDMGEATEFRYEDVSGNQSI